jgi:hypothetical protein
MKKIYEIYRNRVEYREHGFDEYKSGMTIGVDECPELVATFDTREEAEAEFKNPYYSSDVSHGQGFVFRLVYVEEYVLWEQEVEIDEDGDIDYISGDVLDVSELRSDET